MKKIYILAFCILSTLISFSQTDSLLASYSFSGNANDEKGSVHGTTYKTELTEDRFGTPNSAYAFNNDSISNITFGDNFDAFSGVGKKFSFSIWFQWSDTSKTEGVIISKYGNSSCSQDQREFFIQIDKDKKIRMVYYGTLSPNAYRAIASVESVNDTLWHHLVVSYNGEVTTQNGLDRVSMYLDNTPLSTTLIAQGGTLGNITNSTSYLTLGSATGSGGQSCTGSNLNLNFSGALDDFKVYNKILNEEEIENLYYENMCVKRVTVYDTVRVVVYDTIAVEDTLIINIVTGMPQPSTISTVKVYPNPSSEVVNFDFSNYQSLVDFSIKITNSQGGIVYSQPITSSNLSANVNNIGGVGLYYIQIIDGSNQIVEIKKLVIQ